VLGEVLPLPGAPVPLPRTFPGSDEFAGEFVLEAERLPSWHPVRNAAAIININSFISLNFSLVSWGGKANRSTGERSPLIGR